MLFPCLAIIYHLFWQALGSNSNRMLWINLINWWEFFRALSISIQRFCLMLMSACAPFPIQMFIYSKNKKNAATSVLTSPILQQLVWSWLRFDRIFDTVIIIDRPFYAILHLTSTIGGLLDLDRRSIDENTENGDTHTLVQTSPDARLWRDRLVLGIRRRSVFESRRETRDTTRQHWQCHYSDRHSTRIVCVDLLCARQRYANTKWHNKK